jgi:hypothetical protein
MTRAVFIRNAGRQEEEEEERENKKVGRGCLADARTSSSDLLHS